MGILGCILSLIGGLIGAFGFFVGVALTIQGKLLGPLILLSQALAIIIPWKIWTSLLHDSRLPKTPPRDPSLPTFSEFHEQWKKKNPDKNTK